MAVSFFADIANAKLTWGSMTALAEKPSKRRFLLASDHIEQCSELASILKSVGEVDTVSTAEIPEKPSDQVSGVVVDINLRSPESVQLVRKKLQTDAYVQMPRLFVLADALHHASMQAWALGATDTISRPLDAGAIMQRIRAAFPDSQFFDSTDSGKTLNRGVAAAHAVITKIFQRVPSGVPLTMADVVQAESKILKAIKHSSLREWLTTVGCHHQGSYRHCLFVTGFAVFAVAPWLWLVLLSLGVAGAADTGTVVLRGLIVQTVTPDEFRGRVTAADYAIGAGGGQLGSLESGVLGSLTTPEISALSGGLLTIVGAVVIGIAMPAFARYRAPAAEAGTGRDAAPLGGSEHLADVEPGG